MPVPSAVPLALERLKAQGAPVEPLTPDASTRRYYRVHPDRGTPFVLAVYESPFAPEDLTFLTVGRLLADMPLPVPNVQQTFGDLGVVVLDDLGDVTLQHETRSAPGPGHQRLYERAIDHLAVLQHRGAELARPDRAPYTLAFDTEKLMWEMDFFIMHFLEGFRQVTVDSATREQLRASLRDLTSELAGEPRVLCHRDYHSRNLMVVDEELFLIDFQDARLGPNTYDLVSLVRDCYVDVPPAMEAHLIARFHEAVGEADSLERFTERLDAMGVQRHLKALGTFGFQAVAHANPGYARYVPRTLAYIRATFSRRPRFDPLRELLAPLIPEVG